MIQIKKSKTSLDKGNYRVLAVILAALIMAFIVSSFVIGLDRIVGQSMEPTFHENEWVLINKMSYLSKHPQYNDIIVFHKKDVNNDIMIKRVVAVSGDTVEIKKGILIINGKIKNDGFVIDSDENMEKITVNEDGCFVLGDNRNNSSDSRYWENPFVDEKNIIGKVVFQFEMKV